LDFFLPAASLLNVPDGREQHKLCKAIYMFRNLYIDLQSPSYLVPDIDVDQDKSLFTLSFSEVTVGDKENEWTNSNAIAD